MERVILVDELDREVGTMEKLEAHQKGMLHRAFSILVFNSRGQLMLQKRSWKKYHSGGLWTNTCCSHPLPDEDMKAAVRRKLMQEMGIDLQPVFSHKFIYKVDLPNSLTEYEYDYVFTGVYDGEPSINTEEVDEWRLMDPDQIRADMKRSPDQYTHWFKLIMNDPQLKAA